ncbi:MAG TPA: hypothetical protein VEA81_17675 [Burkholderiaceae bacterium]|nr:hypothetical protein [Burkholderiaceae bacterium]
MSIKKERDRVDGDRLVPKTEQVERDRNARRVAACRLLSIRAAERRTRLVGGPPCVMRSINSATRFAKPD